MSQSKECISRWKTLLPEGRVLPEARLTDYQQNCLGVTRRIVTAIQPQTEAEIVSIINIANQYQLPVYTISTGHNWGYGTSLPAADDCAILDLSRMNKILAMDVELGLITLEPGVTQQQLYDYLQQHRLNYYVPTTGAGPSASIVGNALERGFGMAPEEDHFRAVTSIRAVLADGSIYISQLAAIGATQAGVWKWGTGPYLDGLFSQSNMGIVTSMQISLATKPEHTELFVFTLKKRQAIEEFISPTRHLLRDVPGNIGSMKFFNNTYQKLLSGADVRNGLLREAEWTGFGLFRSTHSMASSIRKQIGQRLKPYCSRIIFTNDNRLKVLKHAAGFVGGSKGHFIRSQIEQGQYLLDLANGIPRSNAMRILYQHIPSPQDFNTDPIKNGVGLIWYPPIIPLTSDHVRECVDMVGTILSKYYFPPAILFTSANEKCAIGAIPIIYKKPEEAENAMRCYDELVSQGNRIGCPPYRLNVEAMKHLPSQLDSGYQTVAKSIKQALDPKYILSPGRYDHGQKTNKS
ncbi:MAG: FAD-binding oxidoreductase [Alphaproteobacteria bacterium]